MFQEVHDKVWFIPGNNEGRYPFSNSIFINDRQKLLIDTGIGRSVINQLLKKFGQPDIICYSHAHEDHIYEKSLFSTTTRFIHELDKPAAESRDELYRLYGVDTPELSKMLDAFLKTFHYEPLDNLETFEHGQLFDLGTIQVKVIYAPGHSGGHCCFELPQEQLMYSSDIDLTSYGPWYGALDSDIQSFEQSIEALLQNAPKIIITSHKGLISDDIPERLELYLSKIPERETNILNFLEGPKTFNEMVPCALIQGKFGEPLEYYLAAERIMLQKHLERLLEAQKIIYSDGQYQTL
jgi:glyoxylase-like metal-dependent hydrolase (beta-lactamase superfamily II)